MKVATDAVCTSPCTELVLRDCVVTPPASCSGTEGCRRRVEHQANAVDAIAKTGRLRSVIEDVPEMAAAAAAMHFGAQHAVGAILGLADGVFQRLIKTRPAGAAFEFGLRGEQRQVAAGAGENALAMLFQAPARSRPLRAPVSPDLVLPRGKL